MALWRDGVSITVEVAFASTPLAASPSWTDITDYVRDVPSVFRGRTDEYGDFAPGYAVVVLDNRDRRFDPDYAAGAYDPNVLPMKRIKITWAFAAASGLVFTGFVLGWPQSERKPSDGFVTVTAVDGSRFAENSPLASSAYAAAVNADSPIVYYKLQEAGNPTELADSTNAGPTLSLTSSTASTAAELALPITDTSALQSPAITTNVSYVGASSVGIPKSFDMWVELGTLTADADSAGPDVWVVSADTDWIRVHHNPATGLLISYSNTIDNRETASLVVLNPGEMQSLGLFHLGVRATSTQIFTYANGQLINTTTLSVGTASSSAVGVVVKAAIAYIPGPPA